MARGTAPVDSAPARHDPITRMLLGSDSRPSKQGGGDPTRHDYPAGGNRRFKSSRPDHLQVNRTQLAAPPPDHDGPRAR
jgi:hypothetical protein